MTNGSSSPSNGHCRFALGPKLVRQVISSAGLEIGPKAFDVTLSLSKNESGGTDVGGGASADVLGFDPAIGLGGGAYSGISFGASQSCGSTK